MLPPKYPHVASFLSQYEGKPVRANLRLYIQAVAELANEELKQLAPTEQGFAQENVRIVDLLVYGYAGPNVDYATYSHREGLEVAEGRAKLLRAVEDLPDEPYVVGVEGRLKRSETRTIAGVGMVIAPDGTEYDLVFHHPNVTMEEAFGMLKHVAKAIAAKMPPAS